MIINESNLDFYTELDKIKKHEDTSRPNYHPRSWNACNEDKLLFNYRIATGLDAHSSTVFRRSALDIENALKYKFGWTDSKLAKHFQTWRGYAKIHGAQIKTFTEDDFSDTEARIVKMGDPLKLTNNATYANIPDVTPQTYIIKCLIYAIILELDDHIEKFKNWLTGIGVMRIDEVSSVVKDIVSDDAIAQKLDDIYVAITTVLEESIIEEAVEKHDTLNPKLWNEDNTLKPEVEEKINAIVDNFLDGLKENDINYKLDDVKLVGSNCSYNYNSKSDLDLHLFFDLNIYDDVEKQEMAEMIYNYNRKFWNDAHDIKFYDIPVEIFAETTNTVDLTNDSKEEK